MKWHINKWGQIARLTEDERYPGREVHQSIPIAITIFVIVGFLFGLYQCTAQLSVNSEIAKPNQSIKQEALKPAPYVKR